MAYFLKEDGRVLGVSHGKGWTRQESEFRPSVFLKGIPFIMAAVLKRN